MGGRGLRRARRAKRRRRGTLQVKHALRYGVEVAVVAAGVGASRLLPCPRRVQGTERRHSRENLQSAAAAKQPWPKRRRSCQQFDSSSYCIPSKSRSTSEAVSGRCIQSLLTPTADVPRQCRVPSLLSTQRTCASSIPLCLYPQRVHSNAKQHTRRALAPASHGGSAHSGDDRAKAGGPLAAVQAPPPLRRRRRRRRQRQRW